MHFFKERHRGIPPSLYAEVKEHLLLSKRCNIIQESASPWASRVVVVRKKSEDLLLCVEYRQLNKQTEKDITTHRQLIDHFEGSKYFSSLDLSKGYYHWFFRFFRICPYAFRSFKFTANISTIDGTMYG